MPDATPEEHKMFPRSETDDDRADLREMSLAHMRNKYHRGRPKPRPPTVASDPGKPCCISNDGSEYSDDERRWLAACDEYRRRKGKRFLTTVDHLRVLEQMGGRLPPAGATGEGGS